MQSLLKNFLIATGLTLFFHATSFADTKPPVEYPVIDYSKVINPVLVKKGEYLAKTGDCLACHTDTPHHGKAFAGNLGIETPFGTFYSPNITMDKRTGIGNWTDKQFIDAVRHGITLKGNEFPVMPYVYYTKMSDADVLAIKAYLNAVPTVENPRTPDLVPWPFNVRLSLYGWKLLFFYPYEGEYKNDAAHSAEWNRGAYLVEGPTHCGMCHSPLNLLGAEERTHRYTGNMVLGFYAPDITSIGLKKYSDEQVMNVLLHGKTLNGKGVISGPMLEAYQDSFRYLTQSDVHAIVVYLRTVVSHEPTHANQIVTSETGPKVYNKYCAGCHANGGNGAPIFGNKADWQKRMAAGHGVDALIQNAISGIGSMPPMGNCPTCSQAEIKATVEYMVNHALNSSGNDKKSLDYFYGLRKLTPEQGEAVYQKNCAVCHAKNAKDNRAPKLGDYAAWGPIFAHKNFDDILTTVFKHHHDFCEKCSDPELIAATKYLAQQSANGNYDFSLW